MQKPSHHDVAILQFFAKELCHVERSETSRCKLVEMLHYVQHDRVMFKEVDSMSNINIAIVGAGMIARYHAEAIRSTPGARLVAVHRADTARPEETAAQFGVPCEPNYDALLARADIDLVCICTPSGLHARQAIAAARSGKHVLVEKPMALTLEDADAMIAACRDAGVQLGIALQRRTDPIFRSVRAAVEDGRMGKMVLGSVNIPYQRTQEYYESADWRGTWALDGGGALMNQGIHLVDLLLWYMGDLVEVTARADTLSHNIEVEDCLVATLRFANGALGSIAATTDAAPGFPHRVEVYGDRGGVQLEGEGIARWGVEGDAPETAQAPASAGAGASPGGISVAGHTRIMTDMVEAIRNNRPPLVPGAEGRRSLQAVLAIYEAARSGQAVKVTG
jgi:predicted dehydrogenase